MKQVEYFRFRVPQAPPKRAYLTRYALTREEAAKRFVGAEPDLSTREVRNLPEAPDEMPASHSSPAMPGSAAWKRLHGE